MDARVRNELKKCHVCVSDMNLPMQEAMREILVTAILRQGKTRRQLQNSEKGVDRAIASMVKRALDEKYGAVWHVVVGMRFASFVTHENRHCCFLTYDEKQVLVFRTPER